MAPEEVYSEYSAALVKLSHPSISNSEKRPSVYLERKDSYSASGEKWLNQALEELTFSQTAWRPVSGIAAASFLDLTRLDIGRVFAWGDCGKIYKGSYEGSDVAVKIYRPPLNDSDRLNLDSEFKNESAFLSSFNHPNIVKFIGACLKQNKWCMATEYLNGGSLRTFLEKDENALPLETVLTLALQIANAMEYLHSKEILHRDLNPESLVFDREGVLKLTSFRKCTFLADANEVSTEMENYAWMAPEMINHLSYDEKSDVYSYGMVLWEIISKEVPFSDLTPVQTAITVVQKNQRPPFPEGTNPYLINLIDQCWDSDPNERPSFGKIISILKQKSTV